MPLTNWIERYNPDLFLKHPEYRVLEDGDAVLSDRTANISCSYNADKVMRMIRKPLPTAGPGEALLRIRATGICG